MADTALAYLHPNEVTSSFHDSLLDLLAYDMTHHGFLGPWIRMRCASTGIAEGRNQVAATLLAEDPSIEWLLMIDADMGFAPDTLAALRAVADPVERPIIGALCFAQRETAPDALHGYQCAARPTIYEYVEHPDGHKKFTGKAHYPINSVMRCAGTGAACLLIHRSVFERMHAAHGATWFDRVRGTDGSLLGEDISFFLRCGALDIPLYVHTGVKTSHMKTLWLQEEDFWAQQVPPPATEPVDVIVPVLHRPRNVAPLLQSLRASTGLAAAWFVVEPNDLLVMAEVENHGGRWIAHPGSFAEKVNAAVSSGRLPAPWVMLVGDDVRFRPGWLDHAQYVAKAYDASVIGTNDLGNPRVMAGDHATHMMIRRSYIDDVGASWDGPGIVCHEGYRHWFVDDEIVTAAKQRGVWQMALGSLVEHMHPIWGKADDDDVYRLGQSHQDADRALFEQRLRRSLKALAAA